MPLDSTRHPESRRPGYIVAYTSRTRMYTYIPQGSEQKLRHINFTHTINPILRTNIKYFDTEFPRWWSRPIWKKSSQNASLPQNRGERTKYLKAPSYPKDSCIGYLPIRWPLKKTSVGKYTSPMDPMGYVICLCQSLKMTARSNKKCIVCVIVWTMPSSGISWYLILVRLTYMFVKYTHQN